MPLTATPIATYSGGGNVSTATTTTDSPASNSILLLFEGAGPPSNNGLDTVTDSAGNSYTLSPIAGIGWFSYAISNTGNHLPAGGTISVSSGGGNTHIAWAALTVNQSLSIDFFGSGAAFATDNPTYTSATLAQSIEVVAGLCNVYPGGGGSISLPAGWATAYLGGVTGTGSMLLLLAYQISASTAPVTFAPPAHNFHGTEYITIFSFKPAIASNISPGVGALIFTGYVPLLLDTLSLAPPTGALILTGHVPTLHPPPFTPARRRASVRFA